MLDRSDRPRQPATDTSEDTDQYGGMDAHAGSGTHAATGAGPVTPAGQGQGPAEDAGPGGLVDVGGDPEEAERQPAGEGDEAEYLMDEGEQPFEIRALTIRPPVVDGDRVEDWARWFRTLGDPTRLRVVGLLSSNAFPLCAGDIARYLHISPATLSHHLQALRAVELVETERLGHYVYCTLKDEGMLAGLAAIGRLVPERLRDVRWRRRHRGGGAAAPRRLARALRSRGMRVGPRL